MPLKCELCAKRVRADGSCSTIGCSNYRRSARGYRKSTSSTPRPSSLKTPRRWVRKPTKAQTASKTAEEPHRETSGLPILTASTAAVAPINCEGSLRTALWTDFPEVKETVGERVALHMLATALGAADAVREKGYENMAVAALWAFSFAIYETSGMKRPKCAECKPCDLCMVVTLVNGI
jgi:hypothetical protein